MRVLVTGGAGYIGSHTVKGLLAAGCHTAVFDNLSTGHRQAVLCDDFFEGDLLDPQTLGHCFEVFQPEAVLHFASCCYVGESMDHPAKYYRNNLVGAMHLLDAMVEHRVRHIVFSSSCTVYGAATETAVSEDLPKKPESTYGRTKYIIEQMLADYHRAYGLESVILRYFNAAGADPEGLLGEDHDPETHLIPLILRAALGEGVAKIFGTDYPTPDGTCVRDYIHVHDLAKAHVGAVEYLAAGNPSTALNLGNGDGYSVRQVIDVARQVSQSPIPVIEEARRDGDVPAMVADNSKARQVLGWEPEIGDLKDIVETVWKWMVSHPRGYDSPAEPVADRKQGLQGA